MTEDDAENTRCCGPNGCGESRDDMKGSPDNAPRFCIGSSCMAWRWGEAGDPHAKDPKGRKRGGILLPRNLWPGYCGLAGKP